VVALIAAALALFGEGGFKVAVFAVVPIILLAPPALVGVRRLVGRGGAGGAAPSHAAGNEACTDLPGEPTT
jgi:hypothetical protein